MREAFALRRARGHAALVPYVTAGHPLAEATPDLLRAVADAGADVVELGIPFSDPLADGPTIQRSSFQALTQGATVARALGWLGAFRRTHATPVVLFTYLNPLLRYGPEAFLRDAVAAGAQGLLVTDLPSGADPELEASIERSGLDLIRLLAPTTPPERIPEVARGGAGFLYYISRTGVTGAREELRANLADEVARVRRAVSLPVAVGFGISTPAQAASVASVADGVVVGSALIQALDAGGVDAGAAFVASLRRGMDAR
ncbi:MAG: tryptophan synthase subunit alpha [Gemmatimonadetes bacterium]|nr:tryptophan synthase subunit alpha [Gemmatimonadota bacterium]